MQRSKLDNVKDALIKIVIGHNYYAPNELKFMGYSVDEVMLTGKFREIFEIRLSGQENKKPITQLVFEHIPIPIGLDIPFNTENPANRQGRFNPRINEMYDDLERTIREYNNSVKPSAELSSGTAERVTIAVRAK